MLVLVTGATGFLGRRVVKELQERNHSVRCLVHTPGRERMFPDRSVDVHYGSVSDTHALANACIGVEAVVHLVSVVRQGRNATFDQVNRQGVANMVAAARGAGTVRRFVHVSAIGAANNPAYPYLYSKWQGEQEVIRSGLPHIVFRPSILFGEGDEFLNALAALVQVSPLVPVIGSGRNRFQPIAAEDVARCLALSLAMEDRDGRVIEIGGPEQLSYNEIVGIVARACGKRRLRVHIPTWLVGLMVPLMQAVLPRPPLSREMLRMISIRNVAEEDVVQETFGFTPRTLEGNIDYVRSVTFGDGLKIGLGIMPSHIRDH